MARFNTNTFCLLILALWALCCPTPSESAASATASVTQEYGPFPKGVESLPVSSDDLPSIPKRGGATVYTGEPKRRNLGGVRGRKLDNQDISEYMVNLHNEKRGELCQANVMEMREDVARRSKAVEVANKCVWDHTDDLPEGENLFAWAASGLDARDAEEAAEMAIESWWKEKNGYNFATLRPAAGVTGHFTQMIWWNSRDVGCACHFCDQGIEGLPHNKAFMCVCHYSPSGNIGDWRPIIQGKTGVLCPKDQRTSTGLCKTFPSSVTICEDKDNYVFTPPFYFTGGTYTRYDGCKRMISEYPDLCRLWSPAATYCMESCNTCPEEVDGIGFFKYCKPNGMKLPVEDGDNGNGGDGDNGNGGDGDNGNGGDGDNGNGGDGDNGNGNGGDGDNGNGGDGDNGNGGDGHVDPVTPPPDKDDPCKGKRQKKCDKKEKCKWVDPSKKNGATAKQKSKDAYCKLRSKYKV